jgi:hypothetical protein
MGERVFTQGFFGNVLAGGADRITGSVDAALA